MQDGQAAAARAYVPGAAPRADGYGQRAGGRIRRLWRVRREARRILRLAGPIVLSQLGVVGMTTTDTLMVGPLGPTPLAAVGVGGAIHFFAMVMSMGLVLGTGPLVSQAFGAGRLRDCGLLLVQGVWVALVASVPVMLVSAEGERIARLLGQAPEIAGLAGEYMRALAPGVPGWLLFMAFRQYVEGIGRPTPPTVITLFGLVLNALANHAFIHGVGGVIPAMGAVGTGWATTVVRWSMAFAAAAYLALGPESAPVRSAGTLAVRPALVRRIIAVGAPISGQLVLEVGLFSFGAAVMMGWLGAVPLAAHQIAMNLASTTFMVALGVSLAGQIRVGHHIGARRPAAARRAALATYTLAVGFMATCALVFLSIPSLLVGLYTREPEVVRLGATLLLFAAAFQVFDGAQVAGLCVLRGAADTAIPMLAAGFAYWGVGLPSAYLLGIRTPLGPSGVWAGLSLSLAVAAALLLLRVRHVLRAPAAAGAGQAAGAPQPAGAPEPANAG